MQLKFNDNTTLDVISVNGKQIYAQGAQRDSLEIQMAKDAIDFDTLDKLTTAGIKTGKITLVNGEKQFVHNNYVIRTKLAIEAYEVAPETGTAPAVTEDRILLTLAQLTYAELQQAKQAVDMAEQAQAIAELSALMAGGTK